MTTAAALTALTATPASTAAALAAFGNLDAAAAAYAFAAAAVAHKNAVKKYKAIDRPTAADNAALEAVSATYRAALAAAPV